MKYNTKENIKKIITEAVWQIKKSEIAKKSNKSSVTFNIDQSAKVIIIAPFSK